MSRKHYIAIAAALKTQREALASQFPGGRLALDHCARAIADVCANDNPEFDRARFLTACGVA